MRNIDNLMADILKDDTYARTQELRRMLERVIAETELALGNLRGGMREGSGDRRAVGDVTDDITQEANLATTAVRANALTDRLNAATDALRRLNLRDGSYGVCEECDSPIGEKRLSALPFATRCIRCQERAEYVGPLTRRQTGARFTP